MYQLTDFVGLEEGFLLSFVDEKSKTRRHSAVRLLLDVLVFGSLIYICVRYFSLRVNFEQMKVETSIGKILHSVIK